MPSSFWQDIKIYQGDDWAGEVLVYNEDGTDADITNYTAQAQIRKAVADETRHVMADMLCAVVPPNFVSISLNSTQTRRLREPTFRWDLQIVSPLGEITTLFAGRVLVTREVTRVRPPDPLEPIDPTDPLEPIEPLVELEREALWREVEEEYRR